MPEEYSKPNGDGNPYDGKWEAWLDTQPVGPKTLYVIGVLQMPTPGYTLTLTEHDPQGINPAILLLDLTITPPSEGVPDVITEETVKFNKEADVVYTQVSILPDGPSDIPVKIVS